MKLFELTNKVIHRKKLSTKLPNFSNMERMGQGREAKVYATKTPNTVVKEIPLQNMDNSYLKFIDIVMDHQDNPYFPKIYKATIHKTIRGPVLILTTEKLNKLNSKKLLDSMKHVFENIFGIEQKQWDESVFAHGRGNISFANLTNLASIGDYDSVEDMITSSRDPKLKEAYAILRPLLSEIGDDLHNDNMMVRLTQHGPQLVFNDPLAPSV